MNLSSILSKIKTKENLAKFIASLDEREARILLNDFSLWALPYQQLPKGNWRRWILRCGRGAGKGYTASKWINYYAQYGELGEGEIGIIARTWTDVRNTCIEGPSGILKTANSDFMPIWSPGNGTLIWPNGVKARVFSADKPESIRGANFALIWADEICFWPDPEKTWFESIEPALRLGMARAIISTTPLPDKFLRDLESLDDSVITRGSTFDNPYLSKDAKEALKKRFEGTRRGRQELYGEFLESNINALFKYEMFQRINDDFDYDKLTKIVVSIDPAVSTNEDSDETGIIVAGRDKEGNGYILEDLSGKYSPTEWARIAIDAYHNWKANYIVAEVNQGGDLIQSTIKSLDSKVAYKSVRASRSKQVRAEPISSLYEQKRVFHVGLFDKLEDQMTIWEPGKKSPDRLDAMVWALTCLLLDDIVEKRDLFSLYGPSKRKKV